MVPAEQRPSSVQQPRQFAAEHRGGSLRTTQLLKTHCPAKPVQLAHACPRPHAKSVLPGWQSPLTSQQPLHVAGLQRGPGVTMPPSSQRMKVQYQGPLGIGRGVEGVDVPPQPPQPANTTTTSAVAIVPRRIDSSR